MSCGHPMFTSDIGRDEYARILKQETEMQIEQIEQQRQMAMQLQNANPYLNAVGGLYGQSASQQLGNLAQSQSNQTRPVSTPIKEKKSMFKEVSADIKGFILEHRAVIYFIVFALLFDHFIFRGAFKARLQSMADKVVTKVEEKIK